MSEFHATDVTVRHCLFAYVFKLLVIDGGLHPAEHGLPIATLVSVFFSFYYFEQLLATVSKIDVRYIWQVEPVTVELVTSVIRRSQQARYFVRSIDIHDSRLPQTYGRVLTSVQLTKLEIITHDVYQ